MSRREPAAWHVELAIFLAAASVIGCLTFLVNLLEVHPENLHFGGEYGNIAVALVEGRGFADPFGAPSGPTAWMPPLYPFLLAGIFAVLGVGTTASAWAVLTLKGLALALIPVYLYRVCQLTNPVVPAWIVAPVFVAQIVYAYSPFFQTTHDVWLVMLLVTILLYRYCESVCGNRDGLGLPWTWGILGGVVFLASPVLGVVFVVLTLAPLSSTRVSRKVGLLTISLLIALPWFARNYQVFHKPVFVKSNLFFELMQSNYLDDDGMLDLDTFRQFHPYLNRQVRRRYSRLGESRFLAEYRTQFYENLAKNPGQFRDRSLHRLLHAFLVYPSCSPSQGSGSPRHVFLGKVDTILYPLPVILLAFLLALQPGDSRKVLQALTIILIFGLAPYVVAGFYPRYRIPLVPLFSIIYFLAINRLWAALADRRTQGSARISSH